MDVIDIAVLQHAAQQMPVKIIGDEDQDDDRQSGAGRAARQFQCQQDDQDAEEKIPVGQRSEQRDAIDDLRIVPGKKIPVSRLAMERT
jgi:hypothetical protein